jgi:hypothetical protein
MTVVAKTQRDILRTLDSTGIPYTVELKARHFAVRYMGHLVGIIPLGASRDVGRDTKNLLAQLRRAARGEFHDRRQRT